MVNPLVQNQNGNQLLNLMRTNPQLGMVLDMIKGKDPKDVFYSECERLGVDPESILSQLR